MRRVGQVINKNGYHCEYDQNGKIMYIKNPDDLEMWFNKDEDLIKSNWKDGFVQTYHNGIVTTTSPGIFKTKLSYRYAS